MKVLFFGDVFGKPGRTVVQRFLPQLMEEFSPDFCIANGENIAQGRGVTEKTASVLFRRALMLLLRETICGTSCQAWSIFVRMYAS